MIIVLEVKKLFEEVKEQFDSLIRCNTNIENPKTDEIFEAWKTNKAEFYKMFGERLILECGEVTLTLPEATRRQKLEEFINRVAFTYRNNNLSHFISENFNSFFENKVTVNYGNIQIPLGMKLIKAFKYYEENEEMLRKIQDEASMIIQEDKINGILCLSIHPLDFMSLSENTYNWRSCHALDGEYCAGNLSYMGDAATIICYIKGKEDAVLPNFNFKWNSKKWRMLLFFDTSGDFVMAGKQYPLQSGEALNHFQEAYSKAWEAAHEANEGVTNCFKFSPWHKEQINSISLDGLEYKFSVSMIPYGDYMLGLDEVYTKGENSLQYDDIIKNSTYRESVPYAYAITDLRWGLFTDAGITYPNGDQTSRYLFANRRNGPVIAAGHEVKCLHCGESIIQTADAVLCDRCVLEYIKPDMLDEDYYPACDICGERFIYYDGFWRGDMHVCASCGQKYDEDLNLIENKEEDYNGPWR